MTTRTACSLTPDKCHRGRSGGRGALDLAVDLDLTGGQQLAGRRGHRRRARPRPVHHRPVDLANGVPIVQAGTTEEKNEIAARITWSGAGVALGTSRPKPQRVAAAVGRILADTAYRTAAQRIKAEMSGHDAGRRGRTCSNSWLPPAVRCSVRRRPSGLTDAHGHAVTTLEDLGPSAELPR